MRGAWITGGAAAIGLAALLVPLGRVMANQSSWAEIERGRYLADAGDCKACHTAENGAPFAGGRPIETPFGVLYSPNITPDRETGIGAWTDDEFYRALHEGIAANGDHLYPAFPYPWYTKVTREDAAAIHAFLATLPPVRSERHENALPWPLDQRAVMTGWNALFFTPGTYTPDPNKSPEWNRGAYLVEGLGHCGACHTPRNFLGAAQKDARFQGARLQDWYAPGLAGDLRRGLGSWSAQEIAEFLKTGRNDRAVAYGPMTEVIENSTAKLTDGDRAAIATYLKDLPPPGGNDKTQPVDPKLASAGEAIYADQCSACHQMDGSGVPNMFPALKGSAVVQAKDPTTVVRLILDGGRAAVTPSRPTPFAMPAFAWKLTDDEVAAVASYVRSAWGNAAQGVSAGDVDGLRSKLHAARGAE